jgi:hypothetical protein
LEITNDQENDNDKDNERDTSYDNEIELPNKDINQNNYESEIKPARTPSGQNSQNFGFAPYG